MSIAPKRKETTLLLAGLLAFLLQLSRAGAVKGSDQRASVLEHHNGPARDGVYVDPHFTRAAIGRLHRDPSFVAPTEGPVYAQPLYLADPSHDLVFSFTERNHVYAFDAATGRVVWERVVGAPVPRFFLPCGNIDPLGITGTPVIDPKTRTLYLAAMTTPDGGPTKRQLVFALSADNGETLPGWPVDASVAAKRAGRPFQAAVQNQRGALALLSGHVYVPYGGHFGDCGDYHGWIIGVSTSRPEDAVAWASQARGGGVWAPSGVVSDGEALFIATGNTSGAANWGGGEAVLRLPPSLLLGDSFVPADWKALDDEDADLGGTAPVLVPGATSLLVALGKNGVAYLLDGARLGGIGGALAQKRVSSAGIINAAAAYLTPRGTYVVFKGVGLDCPSGQGGNLTAIRIEPGARPAISVAWCANEHGNGSPAVSMTDPQGKDAVVWGLGAEGDGRLHGFDGDTGALVYGGGDAGDAMPHVSRFQTPIIANERIFVASDKGLNAFAITR